MSKQEIDLSLYDDQREIPKSNVRSLTDGLFYDDQKDFWVKKEDNTVKKTEDVLCLNSGVDDGNSFDNVNEKKMVFLSIRRGSKNDLNVVYDIPNSFKDVDR